MRATCSAHLILGLINLTIFGEDANYAVSCYVLSLKPLSNARRRNFGGWPAIITSLAVEMATMKIRKIRGYVRSEVSMGRLRRWLSSGILRRAVWDKDTKLHSVVLVCQKQATFIGKILPSA
jgi:hypothetical protein